VQLNVLERGLVAVFATLAITLPVPAQTNNQAQKPKIREATNSKEEGNRNVMLNAASANGPREIQIGLPSVDVNVLENGLPITYATNPRSVNSIWRSDASFEHVGLLKISETAITTGNIGYAVNSYTKLGKEACDVFRSMVCPDNSTTMSSSECILGNHPASSLDIPFIKV